ncbi:MAG: zinc chelation protein SecC [Hyphomicrobiaceae bacterium]|nr:zinc chelation protein SecC [Hyphomicrobiaceae bacterium]
MSNSTKIAPQADHGHVHGPDCNHDHDHQHSSHQQLGHVHGPNCNHDHDHNHGHHHHAPVETFVRAGAKIGRNDPCPCGSGKKHKKCCLAA